MVGKLMTQVYSDTQKTSVFFKVRKRKSGRKTDREGDKLQTDDQLPVLHFFVLDIYLPPYIFSVFFFSKDVDAWPSH